MFTLEFKYIVCEGEKINVSAHLLLHTCIFIAKWLINYNQLRNAALNNTNESSRTCLALYYGFKAFSILRIPTSTLDLAFHSFNTGRPFP